MKWLSAVIVANNRPEYLEEVYAALRQHHPIIRGVTVNDDHHEGMAVNVNRAWDWALAQNTKYVLHLEDDMKLLAPLPLRAAIRTLDQHPMVAQMVFKRHPWWGSPIEQRTGDVLSAITEQSVTVIEHDTWTEYDGIFSLNPCIIPRRILQMGWPSGPLGVGNESGMTKKLLAGGYTFGMWGHIGDEPYIEHIGHQRGEHWAL